MAGDETKRLIEGVYCNLYHSIEVIKSLSERIDYETSEHLQQKLTELCKAIINILYELFSAWFQDQQSDIYTQLMTDKCFKAIDNIKQQCDAHQTWSMLIMNVTVAMLTFGLQPFISYQLTKDWRFFKPEPIYATDVLQTEVRTSITQCIEAAQKASAQALATNKYLNI